MDITRFKEEYCKTSNIKVGSLLFNIDKIPAFKASKLFTSLIKNTFGDIKDFELEGNDEESTKNVILSIISNLNEDFISDVLQPTLFSYMSYSMSDGSCKNLNFWETKEMAENHLGFDDIYELMIRGICVNFLQSLLARFQKLTTMKK